MFGKDKYTILLIVILVGCFVFRLYRVNGPIADWHSWRQADTSSVSRTFVNEGYDVLHPKFDDISNVASKLDNPNGYRFVEFPIYNVLQAGLSQFVGILTLEEWGRMISIASSVLSTYILYKLVGKYTNKTAGLFTAYFYAFIPFSVYYGRTILPDPSMVSTSLLAIYLFDIYLKEQRNKHLLLAGISAAISLLLKPYAVFFLLPLPVMAIYTYKLAIFKQWKVILVGILSVIPMILWRQWMLQFPEGIPTNQWLLNGNGIRFRPSFFRWIFYERVTKLILGYFLAPLLFIGIIRLFREKAFVFYGSIIAGAALYVTVFATGNVQHDYYQILILPSVVILLGIGADYLSHRIKVKRVPNFGIFMILFLSLVSMGYSWMSVKEYFNINNRAIIVAGEAVDRLTPKDARVIALYNGDTSFLYQTKRKGWASQQKSLPEMIKLGASYLVITNPTGPDYNFSKEYQAVVSNKTFLLVDLKKPL